MNKDFYTCVICKGLNHAGRPHCQSCGAVPAMYTFWRKELNEKHVEVVAAIGCVRAGEQRIARINLRTVESDYYAQGEQKMKYFRHGKELPAKELYELAAHLSKIWTLQAAEAFRVVNSGTEAEIAEMLESYEEISR